MSGSQLRVFTFDAGWGLPTGGPFGLKLEACLRMLEIPYERTYENDNRKGPKRKSPWIEDGALRLGDTELILGHLADKYGKQLDRELSAEQRARAHVLRRMLEEHYHQIFEYELVVLDAGFEEMRAILRRNMPAPVAALVGPLMRRGFKKHLFERGIARHTPAEVERMGKDDIDALSAWLGERDWFIADAPTKADASAFGLLAVSIRSTLSTPVCSYARTKPNLVRFVDRAFARFFPELAAEGGAAKLPALRSVAA